MVVLRRGMKCQLNLYHDISDARAGMWSEEAQGDGWVIWGKN